MIFKKNMLFNVTTILGKQQYCLIFPKILRSSLNIFIPLEITILFFNNKTKTNLDDFFAVVAIVVVVVAAVVVYKTELE